MSCPPHKMNADSTGCAQCGDTVEEMRDAQAARTREAEQTRLAEATARAQPRSDAARRGWVTRKRNHPNG